MKRINYFYLFLIIIQVAGCSYQQRYILPPVTEGWRQSSIHQSAYRVQKNDTLYSIAWAFGIDYRELAKKNNIKPPYTLRYGQHLYINAISKHQKNHFGSKYTKTNIRILKGWVWPAKGTLVAKFSRKLGYNNGIDIKGKYMDPIFASNSGTVVYSGMGIKSYGKLIIIKHSDDYLSAYAYNDTLFAHEGQKVYAKQKIATMGRDDAGNVHLHFEIRQVGKPVNPLLFLPKK